MAAPAARRAVAKTVSGTVSCTTSQSSLQISAYAYRPGPYDYASATVFTGPAEHPRHLPLVRIETDKSKRKRSSRLHQTGYVKWLRSRSITYYSRRSCVGRY